MELRHFLIQFEPSAGVPHERPQSIIHLAPPVGSYIGLKSRRLEPADLVGRILFPTAMLSPASLHRALGKARHMETK